MLYVCTSSSTDLSKVGGEPWECVWRSSNAESADERLGIEVALQDRFFAIRYKLSTLTAGASAECDCAGGDGGGVGKDGGGVEAPSVWAMRNDLRDGLRVGIGGGSAAGIGSGPRLLFDRRAGDVGVPGRL